MLVLSRRQSESIKLGDAIVVTVVRVAGDKVRLGIEAPSDMLVLRAELDELPQPAAADSRLPGRIRPAAPRAIGPVV